MAYTALKQSTLERLGSPDGTHCEFFSACREAGRNEEHIDALRRLT